MYGATGLKCCWGCLKPTLDRVAHSARARAGLKEGSWTVLEPPAILSVSETPGRAGPPKSGFRGFEELSAVRSRRGFGWCTRWIDGDLCHGGGTAGSFECVGNPRAGQDEELLVIAPEYLFTGFIFISSSKCRCCNACPGVQMAYWCISSLGLPIYHLTPPRHLVIAHVIP